MILYEYKCDCGYKFEAWKSLNERQTAECPKCGRVAGKIFSVPNITWQDWVLDGLTHDRPRRRHDEYEL